MAGKTLSTALLGLAPGALLAQSSDNYVTRTRDYAKTPPSTLKPSSSSAKQFGQALAASNGKIASSSSEIVVDYQNSGELVKRGRVSVFGANYLRQYVDTSVDRTSSKTNDGYGFSLDLWENTLVVGAPNDSSNGENSGMAYVYDLASSSTSQLSPEHAEAGDYFGYSVAIVHGQNYYGSGMVVVGAYGHDHDKESTVGQGCVFVYVLDQYNVWDMVGKLEPQDFEHKDHGGFGYSLSAYGNTIAVGTYSADKAFVFELEGHLHECPHGHEEEQKEDFPAECLDTTDDNSVSSRRQLRSLQGPPEEEEKKWYTEWKYEHILTVGLEEEHKPEKELKADSYSFGHSVALYNNSGILSLAVGAPDAVDENGNEHVGKVYLMSIMNRGDVQDNWYPEGYDHHEEDKQREEAEREQEREEREAEEQERKEQEEADREQEEADREAEREEREQQDPKRALQGEGDQNRFRTWNPDANTYAGDKMGNFWVLEAVFAGSVANGRFGHSLALYQNFLLTGNNPSSFLDGRAAHFLRSSSSSSSANESPIVSGPLFNTAWTYKGDLSDSMGSTGDHFGYTVAVENAYTAFVGAIMSDIQSDGTFGQGAVYVYDRLYKVNVAPTQSPTATPVVSGLAVLTDTSSAKGVAFLSFSGFIGMGAFFFIAYTVYIQSGGDKSPKELVCGVSNGIKTTDKQIRLASMDDSGFSTSSGASQRGLKSAYSGLDTSSAHGPNTNRLPARPTPSSQRGGATRSFTPQAQRSFVPKPSQSPRSDI